MRNLYFAVFVLSVVFLLFLVPPVRSELTPGEILVLHPENWTVSLHDDPKMFRNVTNDKAKAAILEILRAHRPSDIDWHLASGFIVSAVLSFGGWRREIWFSKTVNRTTARS